MKKYKVTLWLALCSFLFFSCKEELIGPATPNTPEANFEALWQEYDRLYGLFVVKQIDWDKLYRTYRPRVTSQTTDEELYQVMTELLDHLDDNHIYLRPPKETGLPLYDGGILGREPQEDYQAEVTLQYLQKVKRQGKAFTYGWLTTDIGYLHIHDFDSYNYNAYPAVLDKILGELRNAKALVVDVRDNYGGEDRVAQYIANRFASRRSLAFTSRLRNGSSHTDFGPAIEFYTEPKGAFQYTKPVVLLTRRLTFSAGETFVLAMRQNTNVTVAGDTTGGALSDAVKRELPNGWLYRVSIADVRALDGRNYEGIGLAPDVLIKNRKEDLAAGKDLVLEKAVQLLD